MFLVVRVFFFKHKTAYEMRISDWSSDVCSSDLLSVIAELSRPNGNRRVFTLFQQRQGTCAIGAPASYALLRGITGLHDSARRAQLQAFCSELLLSGPTVLPFDQGAAVRSEEHTSELQSLMRIPYAVFCL